MSSWRGVAHPYSFIFILSLFFLYFFGFFVGLFSFFFCFLVWSPFDHLFFLPPLPCGLVIQIEVAVIIFFF